MVDFAENMRPHFSPRHRATLELAKSGAPPRFWPPDQKVGNKSVFSVNYAMWAMCDKNFLRFSRPSRHYVVHRIKSNHPPEEEVMGVGQEK